MIKLKYGKILNLNTFNLAQIPQTAENSTNNSKLAPFNFINSLRLIKFYRIIIIYHNKDVRKTVH